MKAMSSLWLTHCFYTQRVSPEYLLHTKSRNRLSPKKVDKLVLLSAWLIIRGLHKSEGNARTVLYAMIPLCELFIEEGGIQKGEV
jgi:hypothetical protein